MAKKNLASPKKAAAKKAAKSVVKKSASSKPVRKPRFNTVGNDAAFPIKPRIGFIYNQKGHEEFSWSVTDENGLGVSVGVELFKNRKAALQSLLEETKGVSGVYYTSPEAVFQ
jgi:hypothetical protein